MAANGRRGFRVSPVISGASGRRLEHRRAAEVDRGPREIQMMADSHYCVPLQIKDAPLHGALSAPVLAGHREIPRGYRQ